MTRPWRIRVRNIIVIIIIDAHYCVLIFLHLFFFFGLLIALSAVYILNSWVCPVKEIKQQIKKKKKHKNIFDQYCDYVQNVVGTFLMISRKIIC